MTLEPLAGLAAALVSGVAALGIAPVVHALPPPEVEDDAPPVPAFADLLRSRAAVGACVAAAALVGGTLGAAVGWQWVLLPLLVLVPIGVGLAVVDWRTQLLPVRVVGPTYGVVVATCLLAAVGEGSTSSLVGAAIGWAVMGGLYFVLWFAYPPGMGYGDVRLAGVLGLALGFGGFDALWFGLLLGILLGGLGSPLLALLRIVDRRNCPFGPFLLAGAWLGVLVATSGVVPTA